MEVSRTALSWVKLWESSAEILIPSMPQSCGIYKASYGQLQQFRAASSLVRSAQSARLGRDVLVRAFQASPVENPDRLTAEIGKSDQQHAEQKEQVDVMRVGAGQRAELEERRHEGPPDKGNGEQNGEDRCGRPRNDPDDENGRKERGEIELGTESNTRTLKAGRNR